MSVFSVAEAALALVGLLLIAAVIAFALAARIPEHVCRVFGHKFLPFDLGWSGTDYYRCQRCGVFDNRPSPK